MWRVMIDVRTRGVSPGSAGCSSALPGPTPADAEVTAPMKQYGQERFDGFDSTDSEQQNVENAA